MRVACTFPSSRKPLTTRIPSPAEVEEMATIVGVITGDTDVQCLLDERSKYRIPTEHHPMGNLALAVLQIGLRDLRTNSPPVRRRAAWDWVFCGAADGPLLFEFHAIMELFGWDAQFWQRQVRRHFPCPFKTRAICHDAGSTPKP